MEDFGVVKDIFTGKVEVEIDPSNACGNCASKSFCHLDEGDNKRTLVARCEIDVKLGDLVQVELGTGNAIFSAFLIFIVPLILMGLGFVLGSRFSEGWGILAAVIGLVVGFLFVRLSDYFIGRKESFQPQVTKILDDCPLPS
jgi:sigma-E factor negative regulatory protein RseC